MKKKAIYELIVKILLSIVTIYGAIRFCLSGDYALIVTSTVMLYLIWEESLWKD